MRRCKSRPISRCNMKDFSFQTGVTTEFARQDDKIVIAKEKDISAILNQNKEARNNASRGWKGDMHHVASIDFIIIEMWSNELREKGASNCNPLAVENRDFFKAKLNDPNWRAIRVKEGVV